MRKHVQVISMFLVALMGCRPAIIERTPSSSRAPGVGADQGRCTPQKVSLAQFAGLQAAQAEPSTFSLSPTSFLGDHIQTWSLSHPAESVHYVLHARTSLNDVAPQNFNAWISTRNAASGVWNAEQKILVQQQSGTDTTLNTFIGGQLHGFVVSTAPVDKVRLRIAREVEDGLDLVEIAGQKTSDDGPLSLVDSGYVPPGYSRKPIGFQFVSRAQWGAAAVKEGDFDRTDAKWVIAHHSSESIGNASECSAHVLAYQRSHLASRGWSDIAYHFLICPDGRVFEGRATGKGVQGAHAFNGNQQTTGISFIGNYQSGTSNSTQTPTAAMLESGARLVAWLSVEYGFDLTDGTRAPQQMRAGSRMERLSWHNEVGRLNSVEPYSTDCAGDRIIEKLNGMRMKAITYAKEYLNGGSPSGSPSGYNPGAVGRQDTGSSKPTGGTVASSSHPCPQN